MTKRLSIALGMAAAIVWAIGVLFFGYQWKIEIGLGKALALSALPPGLVVVLMIGRLAQRRFFDEAIIDGQPYQPGSPAEIDQRVLTNTVEQALLAALIWPALGVLLVQNGPGTCLALGIGFAITRLFFWAGYHIAPPLRAFGFAGTFYATLMAGLWALWLLISSA